MVLSRTKMLLASLGVLAIISLASCVTVSDKQDPVFKLADEFKNDVEIYNKKIDWWNAEYLKMKEAEKPLLPQMSDEQLAAYVEVNETWNNDAKSALAMRKLDSVFKSNHVLYVEAAGILGDRLALHLIEQQLDAEKHRLEKQREIVRAGLEAWRQQKNWERLNNEIMMQNLDRIMMQKW